MTDVIERLRAALNNAMRPGTADSDVNVPVEVARGNLEMAITEIERLRATIANIQQFVGAASVDGLTFAQIKEVISPTDKALMDAMYQTHWNIAAEVLSDGK